MALGPRSLKQSEVFVATNSLVCVPRQPLHDKLNQVLQEVDFLLFVEDLCATDYKSGGRPGIPPGV